MLTNSEVKKRIEAGGSTLLSEYAGSKVKLLIKDPCDHPPYWMGLSNFMVQGQRCPECGGTKKKTLKWAQELAASRGGKCLSTEYINNRTHMEWECAKGHRWLTKANGITSGNWCPYCAGLAKKDLGWLQGIADRMKGKCLSTEYLNIQSLYLWECAKGHRWFARANNVFNGHWCPDCSFRHSKAELEIFEYVKKKYPDALNGITRLLRNKRMELDIYIPSLNKAIEYDGGYWHSKINAVIRDGKKCGMCQEAGIALYRVLEDLYLDDKESTLHAIDQFLES